MCEVGGMRFWCASEIRRALSVGRPSCILTEFCELRQLRQLTKSHNAGTNFARISIAPAMKNQVACSISHNSQKKEHLDAKFKSYYAVG